MGRLEARVTGPMAASRTRDWEFDPGIEAIAAPYTMAAHAYMSECLGVDTQARYEVLCMDAHKQWNWNRGEQKGNGFACTSPDLSRALRRNPHLRVIVARVITIWERHSAQPTGRSPSSTLRRRCLPASRIITTTPGT